MVSAKLSASQGNSFRPQSKGNKTQYGGLRKEYRRCRSSGRPFHGRSRFLVRRGLAPAARCRPFVPDDLPRRRTVEPDLRRPAEARADDGDAWNTRAVRWKLEQFGFSSNRKKVLSLCFYATPCGKPEPLCWNCFNNIGTLQAHFRVRLRIGLPATTSRNQRAMTQIGSCLPRPAGRGIASAKGA